MSDGEEFPILTSRDQLEYAKKTYRVVVVDYFAVWCGPCKALGKQLHALCNGRFAAYIQNENVLFCKIDVDSSRGVCETTISGLPTIHIYHRGQLVKEIIGVNTEELNQALIKYIEFDNQQMPPTTSHQLLPHEQAAMQRQQAAANTGDPTAFEGRPIRSGGGRKRSNYKRASDM